MVNHNNPNITRRYNNLFNLKGESADTELYDYIIPVMELGHVCDVVTGVGSGASGNLPIYTTPTNKDFYLTSFSITGMSDVLADNTYIALTCVINGLTQYLFYKAKISLTANDFNQTQSFAIPIKIDRWTVIQAVNIFTVGSSFVSACIQGYTDPDN